MNLLNKLKEVNTSQGVTDWYLANQDKIDKAIKRGNIIVTEESEFDYYAWIINKKIIKIKSLKYKHPTGLWYKNTYNKVGKVCDYENSTGYRYENIYNKSGKLIKTITT